MTLFRADIVNITRESTQFKKQFEDASERQAVISVALEQEKQNRVNDVEHLQVGQLLIFVLKAIT